MRRDELHELHYIAHIENVRSIMERGILSHRRAERIPHRSVALQDVQDRRAPKVVPGGRPLHEYANLYINARNPMMFKRKEAHAELSVIRVTPEVLDLPNVVITDMNAARGIARFFPSPLGLRYIKSEEVFAEDWRHLGDPLAYYRHQGIMCAEVLIPDSVAPAFIMGAYVSCPEGLDSLRESCPNLAADVEGHVFFR